MKVGVALDLHAELMFRGERVLEVLFRLDRALDQAELPGQALLHAEPEVEDFRLELAKLPGVGKGGLLPIRGIPGGSRRALDRLSGIQLLFSIAEGDDRGVYPTAERGLNGAGRLGGTPARTRASWS